MILVLLHLRSKPPSNRLLRQQLAKRFGTLHQRVDIPAHLASPALSHCTTPSLRAHNTPFQSSASDPLDTPLGSAGPVEGQSRKGLWMMSRSLRWSRPFCDPLSLLWENYRMGGGSITLRRKVELLGGG